MFVCKVSSCERLLYLVTLCSSEILEDNTLQNHIFFYRKSSKIFQNLSPRPSWTSSGAILAPRANKASIKRVCGRHVGPKSGQVGPKLVPSWSQVGYKLGQVGAKMRQVGAKMRQVGVKLAQVGQSLAVWPQWCNSRPKMCTKWPKVAIDVPKIHVKPLKNL